jgi:hypothetical protein
MPSTMSRAVYADMFGPTTGDRVRLADTDLIIEVEKDFCIYGEEVKFGGGKVIRDGMGQSQIPIQRSRWGRRLDGLKQFPAYLNRWDSQQARNEGVFAH